MNGQDRVECERLASALRELRTKTGLSLAALAAKTPYSKSSWERYLNGKALPPRDAVRQLCTLAGERPDRPLALWELAESTWSGRASGGSGVRAEGGGAAAARPPGPAVTEANSAENSRTSGGAHPAHPADDGDLSDPSGGTARRRRRLRSGGFVAGVLGGLAAVAAGVLLATWGFDGSGQSAEGGSRDPGVSAPGPSCTGDACTGKDAEATRCSSGENQPTTLAERQFGGNTVVKVRRSEGCGTVWARVDRGKIGDYATITAPGIAAQRAEVRDVYDAEASVSTPMTAAERQAYREVEVCLTRAGKSDCFRLSEAGTEAETAAEAETVAEAEGAGAAE